MTIALSRKAIMAIALAGLLPVAPAHAQSRGETVTCRFPRAGIVIINTREPGTTITVAGRRYPASSGSYFYQATDDPEVGIMTDSSWQRVSFRGERATRCTRVRNR
jgi:hypothetical protein